MRFFYIVLILVTVSSFTYAKKVIILPELEKPEAIKTDREQIYITEGARIYIYSKIDFSLVKKFGRSGKGTGEFRPFPRGRKKIHIDVQAEDILVTSNERISYFSKKGEFKKEYRVGGQTDFYHTAGQNLVGTNYFWRGESAKAAEQVIIFTRNVKLKDSIYMTAPGGGRQLRLSPSGKHKHKVIDNFFGFRVFEDKIYIGDTSKGFFIRAFDQNGKKLYKIDKKYDKIKITPAREEKEMAEFKKTRLWKYREYIEPVFPEHFPAFRTFWVVNGRIYVKTYVEKECRQEIKILDLQGNILKNVFVPSAKYAAIYDGKYFFLKKNKDEEWELFRLNYEL